MADRSGGGAARPTPPAGAVPPAGPPAPPGAGGSAAGGYLEPIRAAGAVLWRPSAGAGPEVLLVHRPRRDDWTLPKGKLRDEEHPLAAAVREVGEETGLRPVLGRRLPDRRYLKDGWPKDVAWWAATASGSWGTVDTEEVDRREWLPVHAARRRLSYDHDMRALDDFAAGPAETVPLVLLRHTSAGARRSWDGDDLLRPLDASGRAGALRLAGVLSAYRIAWVVTSAAARCVETVLPYTARTSARLRTEQALTAGAGDAGAADSFDREGARAVFAALLAERRPVIVCTHGELVADLVREALGRLGAPVPQPLALGKGAFWVLHVAADNGGLAAIERHVL
ncbi:NUDIX hydrolase [Marinitenerispora sediminis]|uniref:NUDIX hydrolase n=1 Tax=Marinitenerispora sediminis TaxID=1931232 RepID=UPI000DF27606|nr:NUDIX hydrolase [Marinitenerispora sediminis]RCV49298.1 DNA mismatch repair protein MutT [Marinitenerispora sediminis]RCV50554.1 DNA mismatch repair protein MutT [Marinitenerispora sediminis]